MADLIPNFASRFEDALRSVQVTSPRGEFVLRLFLDSAALAGHPDVETKLIQNKAVAEKLEEQVKILNYIVPVPLNPLKLLLFYRRNAKLPSLRPSERIEDMQWSSLRPQSCPSTVPHQLPMEGSNFSRKHSEYTLTLKQPPSQMNNLSNPRNLTG